jgi:CelD/BcsL family acetyltransferase involved in cellulose biosynthesis
MLSFCHVVLPRVLVLQSAGEGVGIVPLVLRGERSWFGTVRVLTYPLDRWGVFYGPIGPYPAAALTAALQYVRSCPRDWDVLSLRFVHRTGTDRGRTLRALRFVGWPPVEEADQETPSISFAGSWNAYWAARDGRWRSDVMRSERRLAEQGEVVYLRYRPEGIVYGDADPRWDLFDACSSVARSSWQSARTAGTTLAHAALEPYLRDAHQAAVRSGGLDLNLLLVGGRPAAFAYNYHYRGHVFGLRMGYNPAVSRHGTGMVLIRRMIEDSFARDDHTFDFGPGELDRKRPWQTSLETSYRYTYFAPGARAHALKLLAKWGRAKAQFVCLQQ